MPLVRIDVIKGRSPEELQALADSVHRALVDEFATPESDRYQVIQEHAPGRLILLDTGLGIQRSAKVVLIQITHQGRDEAQKRALYARLAELFEKRGIAASTDVVVSLVENTRADWSFGLGRAQFLTGEL